MTEERVREIMREEFRKQISDGNLITAGNFLSFLSLAFDPLDPNGFADEHGNKIPVPPRSVLNYVDSVAINAANEVVAQRCD